MPWDAAAAACLRLLHSLLDAVHRSGIGSAGDGGQAAQQELLQRVISPQLREAGALAATRICQMSRTLYSGGAWLGSAQRMLQLCLTLDVFCATSLPWAADRLACWALPAGVGQVQTAMKCARDSPAGGSGVLLAAQLLSLLKGEQYFGRQYGNRSGDAKGIGAAFSWCPCRVWWRFPAWCGWLVPEQPREPSPCISPCLRSPTSCAPFSLNSSSEQIPYPHACMQSAS